MPRLHIGKSGFSHGVALTPSASSEKLRFRTGAGQGHIGVPSSSWQFQYDMFPSHDEASLSVDALVADSAADFPTNAADLVSNEIDFTSASNTGAISGESDILTSRTSTPSTPPGLTITHAHPSPALRDDPLIRPVSRIVSTSAPFTPLRNLPPTYIPRAATPLTQMSVPTPIQEVTSSKATNISMSGARQAVKTLGANISPSRKISSQSSQGMPQPVLRPDDFPVLEKSREKQDLPVGLKSLTPAPKKVQTPNNEILPTQLATKITPKNQIPGILNIATPSHQTSKVANESDLSIRDITSSSAFPPLPPSVPLPTVTQSPTARANPKTLRLAPIPKADGPSISTSTPPSTAFANQPNLLPPSRQPSIASLSRLDRPSTPVSEIVSDNTSITSNSLSRPSSPPAARVGSAPVRSTTKSQQKKQRREAQKEKSDLGTVFDKPEAEIEIAPIMGRKKKQKKEKINNTIVGPSPAISRAVSPGPQEPTRAENSVKSDTTIGQKASSHTLQPDLDAPPSKVPESKGKGKSKNDEPTTQESQTPKIDTTCENAEKPIPAPASVLSDLVTLGLLPDPNKLAMFKSPVGFNQRPDISGELQEADNKLVISEEDRAALQAGKPVRKVGQGSSRIMLTPYGDCVRNLTPAEEERYLELQSRILGDAGPATFIPPRHKASGGFALIGGRAVPNGPPAYLPPTDSTTARLDPVSKIQRDEALRYINQYILPSLSTNSQLERALNANALDAELISSNEPQKLGSWGSGTTHAHGSIEAQAERRGNLENPYSLSRDTSILATGLQNLTAHFTLGQENGRTQSLGNIALLSLEDSEKALQSAKKETEKLEKSLNQLVKKNRKLLLGTGH